MAKLGTFRNASTADLLTAIVVISVGVGAFIESWRMPRLEELQASPFSVPGLVPAIIAVVLALFGVRLLLRSIAAGGYKIIFSYRLPTISTSGFRRWSPLRWSIGARRTILTLALTVFFAGFLVGTVPFWMATFLFVFSFVAAFEWHTTGNRSERHRVIFAASILAVVASLAITSVFRYGFLVKLP